MLPSTRPSQPTSRIGDDSKNSSKNSNGSSSSSGGGGSTTSRVDAGIFFYFYLFLFITLMLLWMIRKVCAYKLILNSLYEIQVNEIQTWQLYGSNSQSICCSESTGGQGKPTILVRSWSPSLLWKKIVVLPRLRLLLSYILRGCLL